MMTDVGIALHTGTHTGIWGTVEVLFAVAVLVGSIALVVALLRKARDGTPEARLVAAFAGNGTHQHPMGQTEDRPLDRRGE